MSERPQGSTTGIFGLFFREAGLFMEQAFQWADQRTQETAQWADQRAQETARWVDERSQQAFQTIGGPSQDAAATRRAEAEARLLEQVRLAKQAGLDVDAILAKLREG